MKPSMHRKDYYLLISLHETIVKIIRYSSGYQSADELYHNDRDFDATMMNFIVIGEVVGNLSDDLKSQIPDIDWLRIYSFRNILAHHYFGINVDIVWQIIQNDIPKLKETIDKILED
jgi:uncharacterized protein with HEPN domain